MIFFFFFFKGKDFSSSFPPFRSARTAIYIAHNYIIIWRPVQSLHVHEIISQEKSTAQSHVRCNRLVKLTPLSALMSSIDSAGVWFECFSKDASVSTSVYELLRPRKGNYHVAQYQLARCLRHAWRQEFRYASVWLWRASRRDLDLWRSSDITSGDVVGGGGCHALTCVTLTYRQYYPRLGRLLLTTWHFSRRPVSLFIATTSCIPYTSTYHVTEKRQRDVTVYSKNIGRDCDRSTTGSPGHKVTRSIPEVGIEATHSVSDPNPWLIAQSARWLKSVGKYRARFKRISILKISPLLRCKQDSIRPIIRISFPKIKYV